MKKNKRQQKKKRIADKRNITIKQEINKGSRGDNHKKREVFISFDEKFELLIGSTKDLSHSKASRNLDS